MDAFGRGSSIGITPALLTPGVLDRRARPAGQARRGGEEFSMMRGGNANCQAKLFVRGVRSRGTHEHHACR